MQVKVLPRSGRDEICGFVNGILKVRVSRPPIEGKANQRLIELVSKTMGVPRSNVIIIKGRNSRTKSIKIEGMSESKFDWFKKTYSN